ncbi:MAG: MarR family transcriptional regulator [Bacteroidota bacterium]
MLQKNLEATIIQYLVEFASLLKKRGDLQCHAHGITTQQWLILLHLANDPNMPFHRKRSQIAPVLASELADFFGVSRANITNLLNVLLEKQLIIQTEDETDRRKKTLELSEKGIHVVNAMESIRHSANGRLFSTFSQMEKEVFLKMLERCVFHISNALHEGIKTRQELEAAQS